MTSSIKTLTNSKCQICKVEGAVVYTDLRDQLFNAPGTWNIFSCPKCSLLWVNPFPAPEVLGEIYKSYYTHSETNYFVQNIHKQGLLDKLTDYFKFQVYRSNGYGAQLKRRGLSYLINVAGRLPVFSSYVSLDMLGVRPEWGKKLLDIGTGNGEYLRLMKILGWDVEGTETDIKAVEYANTVLGIKVYTGFLSDIKLPSDTYDVLTLNHVIEHVHDPLELILECKRILKPGGRLVVLTPNSLSWGHKKFGRNWRGLETPRHIQVFSAANFATLASQAGIHIEKLSTSARIARYLYSTSVHIKQGKFNIGQGGKRGYLLAFKSYIFQVFEELSLLTNNKNGEEIYFIGKKI
jgi:2-polyprenyl-3-methyl-5-hydroxy-6-metoxy-1,4-benzoquinol methylase